MHKRSIHEIFHIVPIQSSPSKVYNSLVSEQALSSWWLEGAQTNGALDSIATFPLSSGKGSIKMKILELQVDRRVVWECLDHLHSEWIGTQIEFIIEPKGEDCELHFRHTNWQNTDGVFGLVSFYWAALYLTKLKRNLE